MDDEKIGSPMVPAYWKTINEYLDLVAQQGGDKSVTTMEQAMEAFPMKWAEDDEYWGGTTYDGYCQVNAGAGVAGKVDPGMEGSSADDGKVVYTGFSTAARDIKDNPKKCGPYADTMLYLGRHGNEKFDMPAAVVDYNPMPYYFTPEDQSEYGDEYPLRLTEGRIPYFHHGTLRNNPYLRELYPAPELWISPENAGKYGIVDGDWVNIKSPRTDGKEVFRDITTGLSTLENMGIRMIDNFVGGYLNFLVIFLCLAVCSPVTALIALAAAVLCALLRRSAARPERKRRRVLLRAALIFGGAALGLLYTAGYRQVALAPVRALDGRTVRFEAVVRDWPVSRDYGRWQIPVKGGEEGEKPLSALLHK